MSGDTPAGREAPRPGPQPAPTEAQTRPGRTSASEAPGFPSRPAPYYSPPPSVAPPCDSAPTASRSKSRWAAVGLVVCLAVALAWGSWQIICSGPSPLPIPTPTAEMTAVKSLAVATADRDFQATERLKSIFSGETSPTINAVNADALAALAQNSPEMAEEIRQGKRILYRLHLLDFLVQDDDEVELSIDGVSLGRIPLSNAGMEVLLPLMAGVPAQVKILATRDGGGGVTFGAISSRGEARTRILQVGESEQWQITAQ